MPKPDFKEVDRIKVSDTTDIVLSEVYREEKMTGYSLNKYIKTEDYTGYSRGIFIPDDMVAEFLKLFPKDILELAQGEENAT